MVYLFCIETKDEFVDLYTLICFIAFMNVKLKLGIHVFWGSLRRTRLKQKQKSKYTHSVITVCSVNREPYVRKEESRNVI